MSATSSSFFGSNGKKKPAARNPFDSDSDDDGGMLQQRPPARASSVPTPAVEADQRGALYAAAAAAGPGPSGFASSSSAAAVRGRYRNDFRDSGGVEAQSVQELEGYAAYKAEETTRRVDGCLRVAEEMRDTASKTLLQVHQQGQQITRRARAARGMRRRAPRRPRARARAAGASSTRDAAASAEEAESEGEGEGGGFLLKHATSAPDGRAPLVRYTVNTCLYAV
ncbi:SNAP25 homologous protein SNAP33-like [Triticum aestivum]|uniref:SNAP25 homologous protein SNAP33-like n=1 Tax=Triticum aestivum TaxID=4565 RepID=UPI001D02D8D3|nr:SNAP25 homologous protein SNAP33-like [Triticum aestivum]